MSGTATADRQAGNIHTNTIEGFWSQLKRSIDEANHSVSAKHLQDYVNEYAFRYNHRDDTTPMYVTIAARVTKVSYGKHKKYVFIHANENGCD